MSTLLLLIALAQTDGGACLRDGAGRILSSGLLGLSSVSRINDALAVGACDQAQRELEEAVRCVSSPSSSVESFRSRIALCRSNAADAGRP